MALVTRGIKLIVTDAVSPHLCLCAMRFGEQRRCSRLKQDTQPLRCAEQDDVTFLPLRLPVFSQRAFLFTLPFTIFIIPPIRVV